MPENNADIAITANIEALAEILREMAEQACEAAGHMKDGHRNAAIGTIIDLGERLAAASALHGAALALHRRSEAGPPTPKTSRRDQGESGTE